MPQGKEHRAIFRVRDAAWLAALRAAESHAEASFATLFRCTAFRMTITAFRLHVVMTACNRDELIMSGYTARTYTRGDLRSAFVVVVVVVVGFALRVSASFPRRRLSLVYGTKTRNSGFLISRRQCGNSAASYCSEYVAVPFNCPRHTASIFSVITCVSRTRSSVS